MKNAIELLVAAEATLDSARAAYRLQQAKIGELMRAARKEAGVTLRDAARRTGLSAPYVSDLELGRRVWSKELITKMSQTAASHPLSVNSASSGTTNS